MVRMDGKTSSSSPPLSLIFSEKMCLGPSEGTEKGRGSTVFRGTPRCVLCFRGFPWDPWGSLTQLAKSLLTAGQWRVVAGISGHEIPFAASWRAPGFSCAGQEMHPVGCLPWMGISIL